VGLAWRRGMAQSVATDDPRQVAGPYHARHAVAIPVGQRHVVVLGDARPIAGSHAELLRHAAAAVDNAHGVPADKLLADELELVETLRSLMAYRPETVRDTLHHVAEVAVRALSCEVALIRFDHDGIAVVEGVSVAGDHIPLGPDGDRHLAYGMHVGTPIVEQAAAADPDVFGVRIAALMTLPLGVGPTTGALSLGHASTNARGFTSLCQRIGRAIADTAELLISQAHAREQLAEERDLLRRLSNTDALTGLPNRRLFDEAIADFRASPCPAQVVSCDLDGLKAINDGFGHQAGDAVIRGAANLLRSTVRESDIVARLGGDEFAVILVGADAVVARRVVRRIRRAERAWQVTEHALKPRLSLGVAPVKEGEVEAALAVADARMYANKRRRGQAHPVTAADRRRSAVRAARV
jgi:diguanylate cyclase (GGDEF)-like protein